MKRAPRCRHSARHGAAPHVHSPTHDHFPQCRCLPPHPGATSGWHFGRVTISYRKAFRSAGIVARTSPIHTHANPIPATTTARMTARTTMEAHSPLRHSTWLEREMPARAPALPGWPARARSGPCERLHLLVSLEGAAGGRGGEPWERTTTELRAGMPADQNCAPQARVRGLLGETGSLRGSERTP